MVQRRKPGTAEKNDFMSFHNYGIKVPHGATGNVKTICPQCTPHNRSPKNRNSKDLSVNVSEGVWNCHNCGWTGALPKTGPKKEYVKPVARLEKLGAKAMAFFESRGISNNTLLRFNVTEAVEWMPQHGKEVPVICFNYYRGTELVNIKFRGPEKSFKLAKDAELIFYNLPAIENEKTVVIVEGEIDALSLYESKVYPVVSVPNGASKGNQKLEYLDNCWQAFEGAEKIVLCVDNDEPGEALKQELARRLGKDRCYTVTYPENCKDANEVLIKHGPEAVKSIIDGAQLWPLEGVVTMDEMYDTVCDYFLNGYPKGDAAGIVGFDELLTFQGGQLTMITGIPGSGKDEFANYVMCQLAKLHGWSWGVVGMEEPPTVTVTKLQEKLTGKAFGFRKNPDSRISTSEFEWSVVMVDKYFHFVNVNTVEVTMDGIIDKLRELVLRHGIRGAIINPWNCLEHKIPPGYSETQYVSETLNTLINFLTRYNLHVFLIAHPTKIQKDKGTGKYDVPTLYSISGSAHFFNKTHNGLCVWRDFETGEVTVYVQKVKWSWLGKVGYTSFIFNPETRQYVANAPDPF